MKARFSDQESEGTVRALSVSDAVAQAAARYVIKLEDVEELVIKAAEVRIRMVPEEEAPVEFGN